MVLFGDSGSAGHYLIGTVTYLLSIICGITPIFILRFLMLLFTCHDNLLELPWREQGFEFAIVKSMGSLKKYYLDNSSCEVFFETGTGTGRTLRYALLSDQFKKLYSSEIHPGTAQQAMRIFDKYDQVKIFQMDSVSAMKSVTNSIPQETSIFFFLDAHFPGELESGYKYVDNAANKITLPLEEELRLISELRPNAEDIIVIDDLRLYEDGPFENGSLPANFANIPVSWKSLDFVIDLFPTKTIERSYLDEGYLIIKPQFSEFSLKKTSVLFKLKIKIKSVFL